MIKGTSKLIGVGGLLGIAFDPQYLSNRYFYVFYISTGIRSRVSRFRRSASNPLLADAGSEDILLDFPAATGSGYHNGGAIHFGSDNMLYVGVGDAHRAGASPPYSQDLSNLHGTLLRINPAGYPGSIVPGDNPFVATSGARGEIWAYGLRNPFTFAVDPVSGKIHINDVGQGSWEEVNLGVRGALKL